MKYHSVTLELVDGDIADQNTDAVVTAAHWRLNGGTGTDGTIHSKGGKSIIDECRRIGACPIGDAIVTGAGNLISRYVIHAVGPVWSTDYPQEELDTLLSLAYKNSLKRAEELKLSSIAFPIISTGAFAYPFERAANVGVKAVLEYIDEGTHLKLVRFVSYTREYSDAYKTLYASIQKYTQSTKIAE